jgi:Spy/CpxP family protein refolding chaperone
MKKLLLVISLIVAIPMFASAFYGPSDDTIKVDKIGMSMKLLNTPELNLSQAQKDKIFEISLNTKKSINSISTELAKVLYEKNKELSSANPDWDKVKSFNEQIVKLRSDIMKIRLNAQVDILSVLTKEQRDKLKELSKRKPPHMMGPNPQSPKAK